MMSEFSRLAYHSLSRLLGAAGRQRLSILIYHRVLKEEDYLRPGDPSALEFDWQMRLISRHFHPLSLAEALSLMDLGKLPDGAVCVTFDDGYADNAEVALPILKKWNIPATVFVSTAFMDGGRMWNDMVLDAIRLAKTDSVDLTRLGLGEFPTRVPLEKMESADEILTKIKHLPPLERQTAAELLVEQSGGLFDNLMLTTTQLKELQYEGIEIGAHTHTHPILSCLKPEDAYREIEYSKHRLEELLGQTVRYFAYPNGKLGSDYELIHKDMVRKIGFEAALSTHWGVSSKGTDRWQMPRFTPWDKSPVRFMLRLMWNQSKLVE